jgi:hypothetical protein
MTRRLGIVAVFVSLIAIPIAAHAERAQTSVAPRYSNIKDATAKRIVAKALEAQYPNPFNMGWKVTLTSGTNPYEKNVSAVHREPKNVVHVTAPQTHFGVIQMGKIPGGAKGRARFSEILPMHTGSSQ